MLAAILAALDPSLGNKTTIFMGNAPMRMPLAQQQFCTHLQRGAVQGSVVFESDSAWLIPDRAAVLWCVCVSHVMPRSCGL